MGGNCSADARGGGIIISLARQELCIVETWLEHNSCVLPLINYAVCLIPSWPVGVPDSLARFNGRQHQRRMGAWLPAYDKAGRDGHPRLQMLLHFGPLEHLQETS